MAEYIWSLPDWPGFTWDRDAVNERLMTYVEKNAVAAAEFGSLPSDSRKVMFAEALAEDAVASSELEGIHISYDSVYSAISRMLDLDVPKSSHTDRNAESLAGIMRESAEMDPGSFSRDKLLDWHRRLFDGLAGKAVPRHTGSFRTAPVYVMRYSDSLEGEIIYEGIPHERIPEEIDALLTFLGNEKIPPVVRSAVAALWFPLIHPFEDGNGRLSRIIADMVLFGGTGIRFVSVSRAIRKKKKEYYFLLAKMDTKKDLDLTEWICWYLGIITEALDEAIEAFKEKRMLAEYMALLNPAEYNSREIGMLYRLASGTFKGKLTADKWKKMMKCTSATATRDLSHLVEKKLLIREGDGGRGTWYSLNLESRILA